MWHMTWKDEPYVVLKHFPIAKGGKQYHIEPLKRYIDNPPLNKHFCRMLLCVSEEWGK